VGFHPDRTDQGNLRADGPEADRDLRKVLACNEILSSRRGRASRPPPDPSGYIRYTRSRMGGADLAEIVDSEQLAK